MALLYGFIPHRLLTCLCLVVAVIAFKTAIAFEMTRRSNDKRILALHVQMKDTMSVVVLSVLFSCSRPTLLINL